MDLLVFMAVNLYWRSRMSLSISKQFRIFDPFYCQKLSHKKAGIKSWSYKYVLNFADKILIWLHCFNIRARRQMKSRMRQLSWAHKAKHQIHSIHFVSFHSILFRSVLSKSQVNTYKIHRAAQRADYSWVAMKWSKVT